MTIHRWFAVALFLLLPVMAGAQEIYPRPIMFGIHGSWADDADFGVGARVDFRLNEVLQGLGAVASFDYFFPDEDTELGDVEIDTEADYWEINANATYTIPTALSPYLGAGVNVAHGTLRLDLNQFDVSESDTEVGANLLAGVRFTRNVFAEAKIELGGGEQFVVTAGFLF
jgi:opacity protein-like surface antigen